MPKDEESSSNHMEPISLEELMLKRKREQEELSRVNLFLSSYFLILLSLSYSQNS